MLARLIGAVITGIITFIVVVIVLSIVALFIALPFSIYGVSALLGVLAGLFFFLSGRTFSL
mgnify:CR=1